MFFPEKSFFIGPIKCNSKKYLLARKLKFSIRKSKFDPGLSLPIKRILNGLLKFGFENFFIFSLVIA